MYEIYNNENVKPQFRSYCYTGIELYMKFLKKTEPFISKCIHI